MFVFSYQQPHTVADFALEKTEAPTPTLAERDVLVRIKAISFNPVDTKVRATRPTSQPHGVVLGWDAAGVIEAVGSAVAGFAVGDAVYYAGDIRRDGCYAELQAVDYRLIAQKPKSLSFVDAATLPLTSLTAQEALFERGIIYEKQTKVLIIGGAGGVGTQAVQLLKALTPATVIATATRPETQAWVKKMGADHVIGRDLKAGLADLGQVDVVFGTTHSADYLSVIPDILKAFGHFILIDDPKVLDISAYKSKSLSVHWEFMFAKSMHNHHPEQQGKFLARLAALVDEKKIVSPANITVPASLEGIKAAHTLLENGTACGKIVMDFAALP